MQPYTVPCAARIHHWWREPQVAQLWLQQTENSNWVLQGSRGRNASKLGLYYNALLLQFIEPYRVNQTHAVAHQRHKMHQMAAARKTRQVEQQNSRSQTGDGYISLKDRSFLLKRQKQPQRCRSDHTVECLIVHVSCPNGAWSSPVVALGAPHVSEQRPRVVGGAHGLHLKCGLQTELHAQPRSFSGRPLSLFVPYGFSFPFRPSKTQITSHQVRMRNHIYHRVCRCHLRAVASTDVLEKPWSDKYPNPIPTNRARVHLIDEWQGESMMLRVDGKIVWSMSHDTVRVFTSRCRIFSVCEATSTATPSLRPWI